MERQIPRSIQYSDLKPEVIENQVKLVRFTPQTNIQNQIPNDIVRFQLQGNGFYDPYSSYISMIVDFGAPASTFMPASVGQSTIDSGLGLLNKLYNRAQTLKLSGADNSMYGQCSTDDATDANTVGIRLSALELNHQNMIVNQFNDGYIDTGIGAAVTVSFVSSVDSEFQASLLAPAASTALIASKTLDLTTTILNTVGVSVLSDRQIAMKQTWTTAGANLANVVNNTGQKAQVQNPNAIYNGKQSGIPIPGAEFKMLDRSAHSFINRLVIRSQGTEIERIEQYDVMAAMLNDLIYSNEQAQFHSFEGFGGAPLVQSQPIGGAVTLERACLANSVNGPRGRVGERIFGWAFAAVDGDSWYEQSYNKADLTYDLVGNGVKSVLQVTSDSQSHIAKRLTPVYIDTVLSKQTTADFAEMGQHLQDAIYNSGTAGLAGSAKRPIFHLGDSVRGLKSIRNDGTIAVGAGNTSAQQTAMTAYTIDGLDFLYNNYELPLVDKIFGGDSSHPIYNFLKKNGGTGGTNHSLLKRICFSALDDVNVEFYRPGYYKMIPLGNQTYEFVIPIYSGIIGVLMPEKKLLPLSMMPLEVDFTLNPHALIAVCSNGYGGQIDRFYTMKRMEIFAHMIFFEQDVHRSMESIVAENGLFIHMNTFYLAPVTLHADNAMTQNIPINLHYKNINSIHLVNLYTKYLTRNSCRKLHFVSHNMRQFQIRNGTDLIPSEPLVMEAQFAQQASSTIAHGKYNRAFIELLKAFNKMHDPLCDVALDSGLVYQMDNYADASSDQATDYDLSSIPTFSQTRASNAQCTYDRVTSRALDLASFLGGTVSTYFLDVWLTAAKPDATQVTDINKYGGGPVTINAARGYVRAMRLGKGYAYSTGGAQSLPMLTGVHPQGSWGTNPYHISKRPNIFFVPDKGNIGSSGQHAKSANYFGVSARLLADKIARFTALTGRFQMAMSLEGIQLGSDNSLLCGKRGMIPFDVMVVGEKTDKEQSMTLVFAKCDFIVYIRPDLVVTVLGK